MYIVNKMFFYTDLMGRRIRDTYTDTTIRGNVFAEYRGIDDPRHYYLEFHVYCDDKLVGRGYTFIARPRFRPWIQYSTGHVVLRFREPGKHVCYAKLILRKTSKPVSRKAPRGGEVVEETTTDPVEITVHEKPEAPKPPPPPELIEFDVIVDKTRVKQGDTISVKARLVFDRAYTGPITPDYYIVNIYAYLYYVEPTPIMGGYKGCVSFEYPTTVVTLAERQFIVRKREYVFDLGTYTIKQPYNHRITVSVSRHGGGRYRAKTWRKTVKIEVEPTITRFIDCSVELVKREYAPYCSYADGSKYTVKETFRVELTLDKPLERDQWATVSLCVEPVGGGRGNHMTINIPVKKGSTKKSISIELCAPYTDHKVYVSGVVNRYVSTFGPYVFKGTEKPSEKKSGITGHVEEDKKLTVEIGEQREETNIIEDMVAFLGSMLVGNMLYKSVGAFIGMLIGMTRLSSHMMRQTSHVSTEDYSLL